jgi:LmbE family N-acetylglucosaminyl deacetylase
VKRAVARLKPAVPDRVWPALLTARSLVGEGPRVGPPSFRRMLVLGAHPDDESLGCAGTMALASDGGTEVRLLVMTDGEATKGSALPPEETARRRRDEVTRAAASLGATVAFAALPDGGLSGAREAITRAIDDAVAALDPEVVLAPWLADDHPDHRAVAEALARCPLDPGVEVWGYETWSALPPTRIVDITSVIERKRQAVAIHETASLAFDVSAGLGLSRWRSLHGLMGRGWAEAFLAVPAPEYAALAERLRGAVETDR